MLTEAENARLTEVGAGTPAGNLLRRYWYPVAAVDEMAERWTKRVRLLGEDLVLFRDRRGRFGLVAEACPHRRASLAYGIPTREGLRCPYHGWEFDGSGRCIDQPNEPAGSSFKDKIATAGYPVEALGGMLFAYLGPAPAPRLPLLEGFLAAPAIRLLGSAVIPCNWLQIMENSVDPIHSEWLHGHFAEFVAEQNGGGTYAYSRRHVNIAFDEVDYGIVKRRLMVGQDENCDDWRIGHPVVFPNILALGSVGKRPTYQYQIRVPMDDAQTLHLWYTAFIPPEGSAAASSLTRGVHRFDVPLVDERGEYLVDITDAQDVMVWCAQGGIADRTAEHLGTTDRGLTAFRRMLLRELRRVEEGADPLGVVRDRDDARPLVLPLEREKGHHAEGFASVFLRRHWRYAPVADELVALFDEPPTIAEVSTSSLRGAAG